MARPTDKAIAEKRYTAKQFLDTIDAAAEWRRADPLHKPQIHRWKGPDIWEDRRHL